APLLRRGGSGRRRDERAVGERDPEELRLRAERAHRHGVDAAGLVARLADLARVVRREERSDDEVADLHVPHLAADLLDDAEVFVAHRRRPAAVVLAALRPEVGYG